jgi:hypothetical protein
LFIDEGCRFRTGRILFENSREQATWPVVRKAFEELWISTFGRPEEIRADPEGVWRSDEAAAYCQERSMTLTPVPAEAHWQIGIVEEAIQAVKHVLDTLTTEFPDMELSECFARAIWACNSRDNSYGYSPAQHAMGRNPDEWGRLFTSKVQGHPIHPQQLVDGGFGDNIKAMAAAEQSFSRFQAKARLARAEAAGRRPMKHFVLGDLVFYWRKQVQGGQGRGFSWSGQFIGPARVLAVETREDEQGRLRPGSCVWLHRAGRLIKAAPEQLRQASSRERAVEELKGPCEIPWTITSLATHPHRKTYWDISAEKPTDLQWQEASDHPTGGRRYSSKKRPTLDQPAESPPQPMEDITADPQFADDDVEMKAEDTTTKPVSEPDETMLAVEISIDIPNSKRGVNKFIEDPVAFVVNQMKRNTVEVRERTLTDEELAQFKLAKDKEVRSYIQSHCFKVLPLEQQDKLDSVGMRWVLTWKGLEDGSGGHKAKARAVILGYQDKNYEFKQTASPTLSRSGRQAFLAFCSQCHFRVRRGDVSSAFLQGDTLKDGMKVQPTREICDALGIPHGSVTQLQRAAYGPVEAPLWWYKSVSNFLISLGYTRMKTEPCIWVYFDETGTPRSAFSGHVDDFLFAGCDDDDLYQQLVAKIKSKFQWGQWEHSPFVQCGVKVVQHEDYSFTLSQHDFLEQLHPININRERFRQRDHETTDTEKSQMRAVLGSLSWICGQTDILHSVDVNFLVSTIPKSTVADIVKLNQLVSDVKRHRAEIFIHPLKKGEKVDLVTWGDAAWANRPDHVNSTEGLICGLAPQSLRRGELSKVTLLYWKSGKIHRKCRSPACAEVHAVVGAEDDLYHLRYLWSEMHYPRSMLEKLSAPEIVNLTPGITITDSKNLSDKINTDSPTVKGEEKRSTIEALALKDSSTESGTMLRWVHSDAQLANSLTKPLEKQQLLLFFQLNQSWRIIYDEQMKSARRRKADGIKPMENQAVDS